MKKRFFKSVLAASLSAALIFSCPAMGSTTFAATADVAEETSSETTIVEEEVPVEIPEDIFVDELEEVTESENVLAEVIAETENVLIETTAEPEPQVIVIEDEEVEIPPLDADSEIMPYDIAAGIVETKINATNFPDSKFRQFIKDNYDTDRDGVLSVWEIVEVSQIKCSGMGISNLKGIEYFGYLISLECNNNNLTSLDVSKNTWLQLLECNDNQLSSLDVSKNQELRYLECYNNNLSSLDVSKNTELHWLIFGSAATGAFWENNRKSNNISSLDLRNNLQLEFLDCSHNNLTSLDVSKNTKLERLYCGDNKLKSLDVSKNLQLETLNFGNSEYNSEGTIKGNIANIDISKNVKLKYLDCFYNNLSNLDVSKNTALIRLSCAGNALKKLDISKNTALESLQCAECDLTSLDVSKKTQLSLLDCRYNKLKSLDVSKNTKLESLYCDANNLSSLDVSKNIELKRLSCGFYAIREGETKNKISSLDVSKNTALIELDCINIDLNTLILGKNTALTSLRCSDNNIDSLNVSGCTALTSLVCRGNNLKSLDISKNTKLEDLSCDSNNLTSLDVNNCSRMKSLTCYNNKLTTLDLSKCTVMDWFVCDENKLTNLNVSGCSELSWFSCTNNELTALDISKNTKLNALWCYGNKLSSVDTSKNKKLETFILLNAPTVKTPSKISTGVSVSWSKSIGADGYYIYRRVKGGSWKRIAEVTGANTLSYTDKTASAGTTYEYTIRGYYKLGSGTYLSDYDKNGKSITLPADTLTTPKISSVSNVNGGVKISWGKVDGAAKYRVYYKTGSGKWTKIADTTSTSYTWKKAKSGTKYRFTVRCISSDGKSFTSSYDSTGKGKTYIAAPKLSSVSNTSSGVKVSWDKVTGAAKYRVYYKTGSGKWTKIADTTSTSYTWKGAKKGTTYSFTVRCISSDGKSFTSSYDSTGKKITYTGK